jgi:phage baseplate assembly protein W
MAVATAQQSDLLTQRFLGYPYSVNNQAIPATTDPDDHLQDLILELLFTNPGERVNLPQFGAGVQRLVFAPNSDALRASTQFLIMTNLNQWLGDRISVGQVDVSSDPATEEQVVITITYAVKQTQQQQSLQVTV